VNPRTTGILFLIAAALGAFVWLYEIRGEAGRKDAEAAAKRLFPGVEASALDAIELTTSDGQRARLERAEGDWRLVQPLSAQADGFVADAIASALAQLGSEAVYATPQPLAVYGLDDASRDLRFRAAGAEHVLRLGNKTPVGGNHYVWIDAHSSVYAVSGIAVNALSKSLDELREKRLLRFEPTAVRRIELRWPDGYLRLAHGDAGWRIEAPIEGPADASTIEDLLADLAFLRASGFVDAPTPEQLQALAPAELEVELTLEAPEQGAEHAPIKGAAPAPLKLVIGARDGAQGDRLVRAGAPGLFRIPSERLQDFPRELGIYRFRDVARFDLDAAQRLEIAFQPDSVEAFTLSAEKGDEGWTSTPEAVDPAKLATMIDELSRLRASRILADAMGEAELRELGLAPPNARLTVTGESGQLAQVDLGVVRGSEGVVARSHGSETVYLLAPTVADYLPVDLEALRNRFVAKPGAVEAPTDESAEAPGAELQVPLEPPPEMNEP
jgi:hypothetical protein